MFIAKDIFLVPFMVTYSKLISNLSKCSKFLFEYVPIICVVFTSYIKYFFCRYLFSALGIICFYAFKCIPYCFCSHIYFSFFVLLKRFLNKFAKLAIIDLKIC